MLSTPTCQAVEGRIRWDKMEVGKQALWQNEGPLNGGGGLHPPLWKNQNLMHGKL